jgi:hypothetical protein
MHLSATSDRSFTQSCCHRVAVGAAAGAGLLAAPQHYMQERVSWIKTNMTGGTMSALFNISNSYGALQTSMCTGI